jgi:hypothetical protein
MQIKDLTPIKDANPYSYINVQNWMVEHITGQYEGTRRMIESIRDLEELDRLIILHNQRVEEIYALNNTSQNGIPIRLSMEKTELEQFMAVADLLNSFWHNSVMSYEEANQLPGSFLLIRTRYPKLWRTAIVWAWG